MADFREIGSGKENIAKDSVKVFGSVNNSNENGIKRGDSIEISREERLQNILMQAEIDRVAILTLMPILNEMAGYEHEHPAHCYDVFEHTINVVQNIPKDIPGELEGLSKSFLLRIVGLLHDTGKPVLNLPKDENGVRRFHGHEIESVKMAQKELESFNFSESAKKTIIQLIKNHDRDFTVEIKKGGKEIRAISLEKVSEAVDGLGKEVFELLLIHQEADLKAHAVWYYDKKKSILEDINIVYERHFK